MSSKKSDQEFWIQWLLAAFFGILYITVAANHEYWRDELHAWRLVSASESLDHLWRIRQRDGHPMGWFTALYSLKLSGFGPEVMRWVNVAFAWLSIVLLVFYSCFSLPQKVLSGLTCWHLFEYTAFARNISIGIFFCFLFVSLFPYRDKRSVKAGMLLSWLVIMQSNLAMMMIGVSLGAYWLWHKRNTNANIRMWSLTIIVLALLAFADLFLPNLGFTVSKNPFAGRGLLFKASAGVAVLLLIGLIVLMKFIWPHLKSWFCKTPEFALWLLVALGNVLFFTLIYPGVFRHFGHIFIAAEVFLWLYLDARQQPIRVSWNPEYVMLGFTTLFAAWGIFEVQRDYRLPYSGIEAASQYVNKLEPEGKFVLCGYPDFIVEASTDLCAKNHFYSSCPVRPTKVVNWEHEFSQRPPTLAELESLNRETSTPVYLFINNDTTTWLRPYLLDAFSAEIRTDERIWVYRFPK